MNRTTNSKEKDFENRESIRLITNEGFLETFFPTFYIMFNPFIYRYNHISTRTNYNIWNENEGHSWILLHATEECNFIWKRKDASIQDNQVLVLELEIVIEIYFSEVMNLRDFIK